MDDSQQISIGQTIIESQHYLLELKKEIQTSEQELKSLNSIQQIVLRVLALNNKAKISIDYERVKQGLIYLNQAEKILQYGVTFGKKIDKNIVISLLHNHATCYQKSWELQKCSTYLQAIIYNLNLDNQTRTSFTPKITVKQRQKNIRDASCKYRQSVPSIRSGLKLENVIENQMYNKTKIAKYYLQFSAINSQLSNHTCALMSGKKGIDLMKQIFKNLSEHPAVLKKQIYEKKSEFDFKIRLIQLGLKFNHQIDISKYELILKGAKFYINYWNNNKIFSKLQNNYIFEEQYKHFSFTNIMQLNPVSNKDIQQDFDKTLNVQNILQKILLQSLGFFTVSTQLRLIAFKKNKLVRQFLQFQTKESQIYILLSIIFVCACIPFDILFINQLITGYQKYFNKVLIQEKYKEQQKQNQIHSYFFPSLKFQNMRPRKEFSGTNSIDTEQTDNKNQSTKNINPNKTVNKNRQNITQNQQKNQKTKKIITEKSKGKSIKNKTKSKDQKDIQKLPSVKTSRQLVSQKQKLTPKTSKQTRLSVDKVSIISKQSQNIKNDIQNDYFIQQQKKKLKSPKQNNINMIKNIKSPVKKDVSNPKSKQKNKNITVSIKNIKSPKKIIGRKIKQSLNNHYL